MHPRIHFSMFQKVSPELPLKVHYIAMSCSRRGPLRYVCGQTIHPTAMLLAEIVEIDVAEVVKKPKEFALSAKFIKKV